MLSVRAQVSVQDPRMMLIPQTAPRALSMRLSTIDWNT
jgi:hypothetical protein